MNSRKKLALYLGMCAVAGIVVLAFSACAHAPAAAKKATCQNAPQWYATDAHAKPVAGIYVCFRDDNTLVWQSKPLTPEEVQALTPPVKNKNKSK